MLNNYCICLLKAPIKNIGLRCHTNLSGGIKSEKEIIWQNESEVLLNPLQKTILSSVTRKNLLFNNTLFVKKSSFLYPVDASKSIPMYHINQKIDRLQSSLMDLESMVDQNSYARLVALFVQSLPLEQFGFTPTLVKGK